MWNEQAYLDANPDVAAAVQSGAIATGWTHYQSYGQAEGRSLAPVSYGTVSYSNFDSDAYLAANPDVAAAVAAGSVVSAWSHFTSFGFTEGRSLAPASYGSFSEDAYLAANTDVAQAVASGTFATGWQHYSQFGQAEGRALAPTNYGSFNEDAYLAANTDVAAAKSTGAILNGWQHYTLYGAAEGRLLAPAGYNEINDDTGQTYTLTTDAEAKTGTAGNDTFNGSDTTLVLDVLDGAAGTDTLNYSDASTAGKDINALGLSLTSIETINVRAIDEAKADTSAFTGVNNLNILQGNDATVAAAATTNVAVSGITGAIIVNGGNNITVSDSTDAEAITIGGTTGPAGTITVTDTKVGAAAIAVDGGTDVTLTLAGSDASTIKVGADGTPIAPTGAVHITSTSLSDAPATKTLSAITVNGGSTITVTQTASSTAAAADTSAQTITQGAVTVTGSTATTSVTVAQTKDTAAVNAVTAVAGSVETASVKFGALKAGDTLTLDADAGTDVDAGELTLTATVDMTAAQVAAAFASLVNGTIPTAGDTQSGATVAKGTYAGAATLWTSAAASGDTVVFTSTTAVATAGTDVTNLAFVLTNTSTNSVAPIVTTTAGVNKVDAVTGVLGVVTGKVVIDDNTTAASIKTISVDGYATTSTIGAGNATTVLDTLTLKNAAADVTMTVADTAATLALALENMGSSTDTDEAVVTLTAAPTTLNVTATGNNYIDLTAAATETLTVKGTGLLNVADVDLAGLKTVTVSESASLILSGNESNTLTSVNTSATTGAVTATIDGAVATYTGGAGVDTVTLATSTALTKAIDLGAGDDTLTLVALTTGSTATLSGGDGTDILSMTTATADALDATVQTFYTNFERLTINNAAASATVDLEKLGFTNYVTTTGSLGTLTLNNLASNGTVVITTAPTTGYTVGVKDAATGTADVLNVKITSAAAINTGVLTAANVETININSDDTDTTAHANSLTLTADKATTLNVTGDAGLTLTALTGSDVLATINASTSTGALTATATGKVAMTITGGSANDVLTASTGATAKSDVLVGGAGDDKLYAGTNGGTLAGGAGNDLFVLGDAVGSTGTKEANTYATITDFAAGDLLQLGYNDGAVKPAESFAKLTASLDAGTAVFSDYVNAAMSQAAATTGGTAGDAVWFSFGGNSYVVVDSGAETTGTFTNGEDLIIKLTGVDLTNASFNTTHGTVALA